MRGWRSPRTASVRTRTGRRKWCARRTASPSRSSTPMPKAVWCSPTRSPSPPPPPRPRLMIDFATLTGACVNALTERMSGVFANRPALAAQRVAAGRASGERVWDFPSEADYDAELESRVADIVQCTSDGKGDHILATRFLTRFVPADIPWAHVDLSSATRSGGLAHVSTDVTGFGVRFALELLLRSDVLHSLESR